MPPWPHINNSLIFLAEYYISTNTSANYLGKYCGRFFRHLQAFRCLDRASTIAAKKGKDVVCLREKKVIVVICAGKSNIRRVDDICT